MNKFGKRLVIFLYSLQIMRFLKMQVIVISILAVITSHIGLGHLNNIMVQQVQIQLGRITSLIHLLQD